ncbi:Gluconate transport-inducing protein, partial [Coemansia sp. RSA 1694]
AGSTQVQYGMPKENGMLKKALSIRTNNGKKLHIIAYYSKDDHVKRRLLTPTSDPNFPRLDVPPNLYPDMSPESMYGAGHSSMCYNSANDIDSDYVARTTPDHHTHHQLENQQPQQPPPPQRRPHNLSIHRAPPSLPSSASPTSSSSAVDDMSAAFHKARVQSLVTPGDVPPASAFTNTSRPAPEHGYRGEPLLLQPLSAPSGSTACIQGAASRPSSNSFSFGGPTTSSSSAAMASYSSAPSSSASAPASSVMRSAVATSSGSGAAGHATAPDDNSAPSPAYMAGANSGTGGYRSRYSGLGLGGGGGGGASSSNGSSSAAVAGHRATPLRSVTTAAVMMHHHNASDNSTSRLPLLLSPISATHLTQGINLAGIRRDVKEGPRRLPSISASLRGTCRDSGSPTDSVATTTAYSPGGLGIFTPSSILSANIPPLPSPLATPRQSSMALGFEGDSLSLLALAADRAQVRNGGTTPQSRIASVSGHHPYSRPWKRGPSMRSVSLKQSEDVRQLGALDQGLRLK